MRDVFEENTFLGDGTRCVCESTYVLEVARVFLPIGGNEQEWREGWRWGKLREGGE